MKVIDSRESVVLRTERGAPALPLLRVVISGLASSQNLLLEQLDDVQLAVETLLAEEPESVGELVLEVWPGGSGLTMCLDGLMNESVKAALVASEPFEPCEDCLLDVRLLLESLVDTFSVVEKSEGCFAVQMDKWA
jgi:hypothetical protein